MTTQAAQYTVRSHWIIENKLRWMLDVLMWEYLARNRTNDGAHNLAILRHMGINAAA
jgi:predicted transposase YbfD/YdcC